MSTNPDTVLQTEGVTKSFGNLVAVDHVDMHVDAEEIVGLIGPNGSGKSTLFNCITGELTPDEGSIFLDGNEITNRPQYRIANRGLYRMFQQTRVFGEMSVYDNMLLGGQRDSSIRATLIPAESSIHERARELLDLVGLWQLRDLPAGRMSFGQQRLLEFAMLLMKEPRVLLLDEPAGGINPSMIEKLLDHIRRINSEQAVTIFLIEHNMEVVMSIADRIYVLGHGDLIAEGTPAEIRADERVIDVYLGRE
jgi:branched-chain amino acid transport system ATP-binding protein